MGRRVEVDHVRDKFLASLDSGLRLYEAVQKVAAISPRAATPRLQVKQTHRVVELAFLGMMASWEQFLEHTTVRYMVGARTRSGYSPRLRMAKCESLDHAYRVYGADPGYDPHRQYMDWRNPRVVIDHAKLFFYQGQPYAGALGTFADRLADANKIRDRVAHASTKAGSDFKNVARRLRGSNLHQGYRPGNLLLSKVSVEFGHKPHSASRTVFEAYERILTEAATRIVP